MNPKLISRVIPTLIALIVITLGILSFAFFSLDKAAKELEAAEENKIASYLLAYEYKQSAQDLSKTSRAYATTGQKKYKDRFNYIQGIKDGVNPRPLNSHRIYWDMVVNPGDKPRPDGKPAKIVELFKQAGFTKAEMETLEKADRSGGDMLRLETQAINAADNADRNTAINILYGNEFIKTKANTMTLIDNVFESMEKRTDSRINAAKSDEKFAENLFYAMAIATLLLIGLLIFFGMEQNKQRLAERQAAQEKAEAENEQLNNSVINILQTMHLLSQRDLTAKAPVTEDVIGTVSDSINALTDETSKVLLDVTDVANQVSDVSTQVQQQAALVSQTSESERQSVRQMTEALTQSTNTMNDVAQLADNSNDSARQAALATQDALDTVQTTVTEMESIRETIAQTEKRIKRLGERSQEISGIVGLINTISERTHVLALNASMQAAVAGEAGRGFAVVAEEVQRLAESSRNATEQIETLVKNIQVDTNETISTVNETIARVVKGSEQAEKAGQQMSQTREITANLVAQVLQISDAIEQQKTTSNDLLASVQQIGLSAEDTAKQIDQQNIQTSMLQSAAKKLVESVGVFKLPNAS